MSAFAEFGLKRSLRDLGLAEFDPCVNFIFPAVLFINGLRFDTNPKSVFAKEKNWPLRSPFAFVDLYF